MAMGPIPWTAIDRWAERHGIEEADEFCTLIRACDTAYLKATAPKKHG